jgi:small subunit ribosomal protein S2
MSVPAFTMRELIDAGVHFGHKKKRWNPVMAPYIHGTRNNVHIIDLQQTVPMLHRALRAVRSTALRSGRILFVGTKRQASDAVAEAAKRCGQYYVNKRWLGGMLTNWKTIQNSIKQLKRFEEILEDPENGLTKKELLSIQRHRDKLEHSLGGIRNMGNIPDLIFIIDTNREDLAINEAKKLGIPVVAIVDTNASPEGIAFPIPGNDDASRAVKLYCRLISEAALSGLKEGLVDVAVAEEKPAAIKAEKTETADAEKAPATEVEAKAETETKSKPKAKAKAEPKADAKKATAKKPAKAAKKTVTSSTKKEELAKEAKKAAKTTKKAPAKKADAKDKEDEAVKAAKSA